MTPPRPVLFVELPPAKRLGGLEATTIALAEALPAHGWTATRSDTPETLAPARATSAVVHFHGLWNPAMARLARRCRAAGVPYVVSPHGMLEPWAWQHKRWKKRLGWWLFQRQVLQHAAAIVATAPAEADNLRPFRLRPPVAVVPNGVAWPPPVSAALAEPGAPAAVVADPPAGAPRVALFLSRLQRKKGLPLLLEAWAQVRPAGWQLLIHGPDEEGHLAEVTAQIARLGLGEVVRLGPALQGGAKWEAYARAELFVLPTHSENFGLVVAEALAVGTPVLTTTGAPWAELVEHRAGWWVPPTVPALQQALTAATALPTAKLRAMGARGRALVEARYTWSAAAGQLARLYERVAG